jgi:anaerobic selenocysteine-containing dehydrogenase
MPPLKGSKWSVGRREFIAGLGGVGLGVGLGKVSHWFPLPSPATGPDWAPGRVEHVPSTCVLCPSHCGIRGRLVDGTLVSIEGNPIHPVSRGGLCPKGKAGLQTLYHPARLTGALERTASDGSSGFAPVSWETALERVAGKLRSLREAGRPDSVAWIGGEVSGSMRELIDGFLRAYGTPHHVREDYGDGSEQVMRIAQGIEARPALDLDRADLVLSFGAPLAEAWWCLPQAASARVVPSTGTRRWLQVDTRLSRTATGADEWIPIRPGSYGTLALSIAYVLLKEGLYDNEFVQQRVTGFEDWTDEQGRPVSGFRNLVLRYGRPDDVAPRIGLSADEIVRLAKQFGRARRPLAVWDNVVGWSRGGFADALAIHALNVLVGSIQRPGGVFFQDPAPFPSLEQMSAAGPLPEPEGPPLKATDWTERIVEPDGPRVEVLFLYRANPVASAPDPDKVRRALEQIPLIVSFSPFLDETARHAHLVLPDHTYLERWQDAPAPSSVPYQVWGVVQPVVQPLHDTRATGDLVLDLASRIGDPVTAACPWSSMEELVRERGKALAAVHRGSVFESTFRREELRELEARGWWLPHGQDAGRFWEVLRESGGWFDLYHDDRDWSAASRWPDGRIALFPQEARTMIAGAVPGLVEGFLPLGRDEGAAGRGPGAAETAEEYRLKLVPYRVMTLASGTTSLAPWLLENLGPLTGSSWEVWVEVNPETGHELGLTNGQKVRVSSSRGGFTAQLRFFAGAQPGVVNAPYGLHSAVEGWETLEPANPLAAVGDRRDPITGLPDWYSTQVRIDPV